MPGPREKNRGLKGSRFWREAPPWEGKGEARVVGGGPSIFSVDSSIIRGGEDPA